jgi:hypothetical protein
MIRAVSIYFSNDSLQIILSGITHWLIEEKTKNYFEDKNVK